MADDVTELRGKLRMYLDLLNDNCASFDQGRQTHALSMAVTMRLLLRDWRKNSVSLLTQLGASDIALLTTSPPIAPGAIFAAGSLSAVHVQGGPDTGGTPSVTYMPLLGAGMHSSLLPRKDWWLQQIYVGVANMKRCDIVLTAADKEAAHADPGRLPEGYAALKAGIVRVCKIVDGDIVSDLGGVPNVHIADIRQVAYEVLHSASILELAA